MTITIINLTTINDIAGVPNSRAATILIDGGGNTYRHNVGGIPLPPADAVAYLDGMAAAQTSGQLLTAQEVWRLTLTPLQQYFGSIILSLHDDVGNGAVMIDQMLTNAAAIIATNPTQQADFNAYRTRLGLGGAISSMTTAQKNNLLVIGLGWATAGLTVAKTLNQ